jgi:hypothetical protein
LVQLFGAREFDKADAIVSRQRFIDFAGKQKSVLFQAFQFQTAMVDRLGGRRFWRRQQAVRYGENESDGRRIDMQDYYRIMSQLPNYHQGGKDRYKDKGDNSPEGGDNDNRHKKGKSSKMGGDKDGLSKSSSSGSGSSNNLGMTLIEPSKLLAEKKLKRGEDRFKQPFLLVPNRENLIGRLTAA